MKIEYLKIEKIKPYNKNAKKHSQKQIKQVADSIARFGIVQPLVVDKDNELIIGHCRLEALKSLNKTDVPVVRAENLSEKEVKALRLADNKLNESEWDMGLVVDELKGLDDDLVDLSGFDRDLLLNDIKNLGWNPEKTDEAELGDGIYELVGYGLQSFWKDIRNENAELFKYWIDLPVQPNANLVKQKYSRTNLEEIRRVIKTYMREGDYFLESCCGWSTFSCSAVLQGFSGVGVDIWDIALAHGKKQYDIIKNINGVGKYEIKNCDAMNLSFNDNIFDFVYCNPPFMDEEKYSGLGNDIATKDKIEFENKFIRLMKENYRVLKDDCLCVITINDRREKGFLEPLQAKVIEWGLKVGFKLWDFVIAEVLSQKIRLRKKDYEKKRTVKCHEYIIIFKKSKIK